MVAKAELEIKAQITELNRGLQKTQQELKDIRVESKKTSQAMQKNVDKSNESLKRMTGFLKGIITIGAFVSLTRNIIKVRGEFQRFNAVLTNSLGSAQEANKEFSKIQQFAAETPFSVRELTSSFVKLVNQGFKPTTIEMQKMADLAAAVGKSFDQLTEAIIDAQTGEFERLKEFGIIARKSGDEVTFSFKEVQTTVEFTNTAIREYILSLGELDGIMGSTEAISNTLEGRINNLGDSWDSLMDVMGGRSEGIMFGVITGLGNIIDKVKELLELSDPTTAGRERGAGIVRMLTGEDGKVDLEEINKELDFFTDQLEDAQAKLSGADLSESIFGEERGAEIRANAQDLVDEYQGIVDVLEEAIEAGGGNNDVIEEEIETIKSLTEQVKKLNEEKINLSTTDRTRIQEINEETDAIKAQIKELENLRDTIAVTDIDLPVEDLVIVDPALVEDNFKERDEIEQFYYDLARQRAKEGEADDARLEAEKQRVKEATTQQAFRTGTALLNSLGQLQQQRLEEDLKNAGENEFKKEQIIREFNKKQQTMAVAQTLISGAEAIVRNSQQLGFLPAIPINILQAIQTAASVAVIKAQKFRQGGYEVLQGRRHHQGGIQIPIGEAEAGEGHAVFSREATKKFGKFIPAFVKQINEGNMPGNLLMMEHSVNLDDSKQLEEIKLLLQAREKEVRYDGRYKIVKSGNVITKVRT